MAFLQVDATQGWAVVDSVVEAICEIVHEFESLQVCSRTNNTVASSKRLFWLVLRVLLNVLLVVQWSIDQVDICLQKTSKLERDKITELKVRLLTFGFSGTTSKT